jgi:RHS repeat-associated protein
MWVIYDLKFLAEYQPQSNQLYYYTTDQVNSVRVVTNQTGVRVFAAAYDPYGGIQKIWENSYSPGLKFSGKERDSESNLDYFGARYYANYYYRWLSPDPVVNKEEALKNPQLWNLYSFCRNNPATYWDPTGDVEIISAFSINYLSSIKLYKDFGSFGGAFKPSLSLNIDVIEKGKGVWSPRVTIKFAMNIYIPVPGDEIYGRTGYPKSPEDAKSHEFGHAYLGFIQLVKLYAAAEELESLQFSSEYVARKVAMAGKLFLSTYNLQLGIENQMQNKFYDHILDGIFGIRIAKPGQDMYSFLDALFK